MNPILYSTKRCKSKWKRHWMLNESNENAFSKINQRLNDSLCIVNSHATNTIQVIYLKWFRLRKISWNKIGEWNRWWYSMIACFQNISLSRFYPKKRKTMATVAFEYNRNIKWNQLNLLLCRWIDNESDGSIYINICGMVFKSFIILVVRKSTPNL